MAPATYWRDLDRKRLRSWMEALGIRQHELARRLAEHGEPITQPAIHNLLKLPKEGGTRIPRRPSKAAVANALGLEVAQLEAGPQKRLAIGAIAELRVAAKDNAGAIKRWAEHRNKSSNNGEWPGRAPEAVRKYFESLRSVTLARALAFSPNLENAIVLYVALKGASKDKALPEMIRKGADFMKGSIWRILAESLYPIDGKAEDEVDQAMAVEQEIREAIDAMRVIENGNPDREDSP
jgi:hypothetical protein